MERKICLTWFLLFFLSHSSFLFGQVLEKYELSSLAGEQRLYRKIAKSEVYLNLKTFPKAEVRVNLPPGTSFFVDNRPWYYSERDTSLQVSLSALTEGLREMDRDSLRLTFLNDSGKINKIKVAKGYFGPGDIGQETADMEREPDIREKSHLVDFFIVAALLILTVLAVFRTVNPSVLSSMLKPSKLFEAEEEMESGFVSKVFSASTVFYILVVSMAIALIGLVVAVWAHPLGVELSTDNETLFFFWLCGILVCMALGFLKFFWIKIAAFIFRLEVVEVSQFMFMLRVISLIALSVFLALLVAMVNFPFSIQENMGVLVSIMFFVYLLGVGLFLAVAQSAGSFKFYHLFSYICTSELIPFLVITKLLMG
jgi:hypothetical protein